MGRDVTVHTVETLSAVLEVMRKEFEELEQSLATMKALGVERIEITTGQAEFDRAQTAISVYAKYVEAAIKKVRTDRGDFGLRSLKRAAPGSTGAGGTKPKKSPA